MEYISGQTDIHLKQGSVVALGNFDGIHLGHQELLKRAKELAHENDLLSVALSFYPHPTWVLGREPKPLVMSRQDRKHQMQAEGIDVFIEYPFTVEFACIHPKQFFKEILIDKLQAKGVVIGSNYYFGKNKQGDIHYMTALGEHYGVAIHVVDTIKKANEVISSTRIRSLISDGQVEEAATLLGHPYTVVGTVVHGKKIGRTIGFPTINVIADPDRIHPPNGVYATTVKVYNQTYMGITNVGINPTIGNNVKMIETHILNFNGDLYGAEVEVAFHKFIRSEFKFESIQVLSQQIAKDTEEGRNFLSTFMK